MEEENQQQVQQVTKEQQQITTKNPKKVEAGKRLAAHNCRRREEKKKEVEKVEVKQIFGIGVVLAVGVIGGLGYYIYQAKKGEASGEQPSNPQRDNPLPPQTNKFEMD